MELNRISVTKITQALRCELMLWHTLTQPPVPKKSVYLSMGSVFHKALEWFFKGKVEKRDPSLSQVLLYLWQEWAKVEDQTDFEKMDKIKAKSTLESNLRTYLKDRCPVLFPRSYRDIERFFEFKANQGDKSIVIMGKIDLITKDGTIVDHKTGRQDKDWQADPQAHLYQLGLISTGDQIKGFQFSVVNNGTVKVFDVSFNQDRANELLNFVFRLQKNFKEEIYLANRKECKFCDWKKICKESTYFEPLTNNKDVCSESIYKKTDEEIVMDL